VAGVVLSVSLLYLLMSYYRAFLYLYPEHCICHRVLWGTKAAVLSVTIKETYSVYMCTQPGSFTNLVVNSTRCLPLESVALSGFTQCAITHFLQTTFSSFCYLFWAVFHIKLWGIFCLYARDLRGPNIGIADSNVTGKMAVVSPQAHWVLCTVCARV